MEKEKSEELKKYYNILKSSKDYISEEEGEKIIYAYLNLIYLAKKNTMKLQTTTYSEFAEPVGEVNLGFNILLNKLLKKYEKEKDTEIYDYLKDVKILFNEGRSGAEDDERLFDLMSKLTKSHIKELLGESILSRENNSTSKELSELTRVVLNITMNDCVLDFGSGKGNFLTDLTKIKGMKLLYGIDINSDNSFVAKSRLLPLTENNAKIIKGDALTYQWNQKFDKIFCEYPLGLRLDKYMQNKLSQNSYFNWDRLGITTDWRFLERVFSLLKSKGMAAIIMTDGPLFKSIDRDLRRELLRRKIIKYIVKLPYGILPYSSVCPNLIILSKDGKCDKIKFVDASNEYRQKHINVKSIIRLINGVKKDENKVKTVRVGDICQTEDLLLTVGAYIGRKNPNYINPQVLSNYLIGNYRGYQMFADELEQITNPKGEYELLTIGNINDGIISNNLTRIDGNSNKHDKYLLKDGDVVIAARGTQIKVAVAEVNNRKIVPTSNIIVLRLRRELLDPYYLLAYLNSENGKLSLEQIQTGAYIISINTSRLAQMNVSMVDKETQEIFVEKYKQKMNDLCKAQKRVEKLKNQLDNLFVKEIEKNNN